MKRQDTAQSALARIARDSESAAYLATTCTAFVAVNRVTFLQVIAVESKAGGSPGVLESIQEESTVPILPFRFLVCAQLNY